MKGDGLLKINTPKKYIQQEIQEAFDKSDEAGFFLDDNTVVKAFAYSKPPLRIALPVPHPVVLYFETGRSFIKHMTNSKSLLLKLYKDSDNPQIGDILHKYYSFHGNASACIYFLFLSLESFINYIIPNDFIYIFENGKSYPYEKFIRHKFFEKHEIVSSYCNKSFAKDYPDIWKSIEKLKTIRDEITHLKQMPTKAGQPKYNSILRSVLDFDYNEAACAVRDFINYYEPDLIQECNCGVTDAD